MGQPPPIGGPGGRWILVYVCVTCGLCREQGGGSRGQRCSAVRGVDVGGGFGVGCFAGSPWREAQQSLMLSSSGREGAREEKREKERQR